MIEIIVKVCRVISLEQGHFMLIGIDGSGKKTLAHLASFLLNYEFFSQNNFKSKSEFRKEIFEIMKV